MRQRKEDHILKPDRCNPATIHTTHYTLSLSIANAPWLTPLPYTPKHTTYIMCPPLYSFICTAGYKFSFKKKKKLFKDPERLGNYS